MRKLATLIVLALAALLLASACDGEGEEAPPEPTPTPTEAPPEPTPTPTEAPPEPTPTPTPTARPTRAPTATAVPPLTLESAISQGLVQAQITGISGFLGGTSSGDAIMVGLTRTTNQRLEIDVSTGTVLVSSNPAFQDMVVRKLKGATDSQSSASYSPTSKIVLNTDEQRWFLLEAYCLNFERDNPTYDTSFSMRGPSSAEVTAVLKAADELSPSPSIGAIQAAVWAISENISKATLLSRFSVDDDDIAQARSLLEAVGIDPTTRALFAP